MRLFAIAVAVGALAALVLYAIGFGWFGEKWKPSSPAPTPRPPVEVEREQLRQAQAVQVVREDTSQQILFGDLHVHSTFSIDAFFMSLPSAGGDGLHPVSDACDFARYCSALDFFSINDHAETLSPARWRNTIDEVRQCNAVAESDNPDLVAFLGWEWTQAGLDARTHYGHKNVIIRGLEDDEIIKRPVASLPSPASESPMLNQPNMFMMGLAGLTGGGRQDALANVLEFRSLSACDKNIPADEQTGDCMDFAATPNELFRRLDEWDVPSMVIPHGTTWGMYTPPGSRWDKQLQNGNHDPSRQRLLEIYSGHGNAEEFRAFSEAIVNKAGPPVCPEPANNFVPGCWRAGEIIYERCIKEAGTARDCNALAADARRNFLLAPLNSGDKTVPGARAKDWLDAGQCRDCWQAAFNYRPRNSAQYILALRNFEGDEPTGFRFGFIGSSDNHSARPGTGYKEFARDSQTEARFDNLPAEQLQRVSTPSTSTQSLPIMHAPASPFLAWNFERAASWFLTGGLVAVHADSRGRDDIWDALSRQQVYATSGPRILLWFDLRQDKGNLPMGGEATADANPTFEVTAIGSFEQKPGCPDWTTDQLSGERIAALCNGECYNPSDIRKPITRIEVVRIRPQITPDENIATLVEDPWQVLDCPADGGGCQVEFTDPDYAATGRDTIYYVRAIEAPSPAIGASPYTCERDDAGNCLEINNLCDERDDDCLEMTEERAWSSPIYLNYGSLQLTKDNRNRE